MSMTQTEMDLLAAEYDDQSKGFQPFVTKEDFLRIAALTSGSHTYALIFRSAGEDTVRRLERGAGAKPHDILEKTVKPQNDEDDVACAARLNITAGELKAVRGFVGHYNAKGHLKGIYLTEYGYRCLKDNPCVKKKDAKRPYLHIKKKEDGKTPAYDCTKLAALGQDWETYFFTWDYDLHDALQKSGGWQYMVEHPANTAKDTGSLNYLVDRAAADAMTWAPAGAKLTPAERLDYRRIQHGPQFSYLAHMINCELLTPEEAAQGVKPAEIKWGVANYSEHLAVCKEGTWSILEDKKTYDEFMQGLGLTPKVIWGDGKLLDACLLQLKRFFGNKIKVETEKKQ